MVGIIYIYIYIDLISDEKLDVIIPLDLLYPPPDGEKDMCEVVREIPPLPINDDHLVENEEQNRIVEENGGVETMRMNTEVETMRMNAEAETMRMRINKEVETMTMRMRRNKVREENPKLQSPKGERGILSKSKPIRKCKGKRSTYNKHNIHNKHNRENEQNNLNKETRKQGKPRLPRQSKTISVLSNVRTRRQTSKENSMLNHN